MTDQIEQLFKQARETEVALPEKQFLSKFNAELEPVSLPTPPRSYDWILMVAAVLAVVVVFFLTPVSFWLSAIPYLSVSAETLVFMSVGALATAMSYYWLLDKDPI